jgi:hypothetical protein
VSEILSRTVTVSYLVLFSVVLVCTLELLSALVLAKMKGAIWLHQRVQYVALYCIHPLTGSDQRLSWSKIVTGAIIAGYYVKGVAFMPQGVAYWVIAASHGTKVLLALISQFRMNVEAKESLTLSKQIVEHVLKFRDKTTGEPMPGAPGQPLPDVAPSDE